MAQANIKAVITAEDRASGALKGFSNSVENMGDKVKNSMKTAAVAFGAASVAATTFAVKSAADFEQTRTGLENMLGSADAARAMLAKVSKFAAETPFEFPELAQATRQLVAFGFSGEDAFKTMTQLGDVSAAIGAPINDLAYLMGTLRAQGRAFTIDIRQFAMRGIPIYEYLAKVMKVNTQQLTELIETGKIGFPEVQKAFQLMTAEGGKFHGTMAKQSKTLSGLFSTLKDVIGQTARELVGITQEGDIKQGSLFDKLRQGTAGLIEVLPTAIDQMKQVVRDILPQLRQWATVIADTATQIGDYLAPKIVALWHTVQESMPTFRQLYNEVLQPLAVAFGTTLVAAIGLAIDAINAMMAILTPSIQWMLDHKWIVLAMAAAFVSLGVAMNFNTIVAAFNGAINSAIITLNTMRLITLPSLIATLGSTGFAFGVLGAAASLAAGVIIDAGNRAKQAWDNTKNAIDAASRSDDEAIRKIHQSNLSPAKKAEMIRSFTGYASGGFTGRGGSNDVAGIVHKGEYVLPQSMVNQSTGTPKMGGNITLNVNVGMYSGSEIEKRKLAKTLLDAMKDLAGSSNMTLAEMIK